MTKRPTTLGAAMARKQAPEPAPFAKKAESEIRTLTMRLVPLAHDQLREMAFAERRSQQSVLAEALNDWFIKRGRPPVVPLPS